MVGLYEASRDDLATALADQPAFRVKQVWEGLYEHFQRPAEMLTLPKDVRARLDEHFPLTLSESGVSVSDRGDTVKFLWRLADGGHPIETVLTHTVARSR